MAQNEKLDGVSFLAGLKKIDESVSKEDFE